MVVVSIYAEVSTPSKYLGGDLKIFGGRFDILGEDLKIFGGSFGGRFFSY